jgi:hypothetical protein
LYLLALLAALSGGLWLVSRRQRVAITVHS